MLECTSMSAEMDGQTNKQTDQERKRDLLQDVNHFCPKLEIANTLYGKQGLISPS